LSGTGYPTHPALSRASTAVAGAAAGHSAAAGSRSGCRTGACRGSTANGMGVLLPRIAPWVTAALGCFGAAQGLRRVGSTQGPRAWLRRPLHLGVGGTGGFSLLGRGPWSASGWTADGRESRCHFLAHPRGPDSRLVCRPGLANMAYSLRRRYTGWGRHGTYRGASQTETSDAGPRGNLHTALTTPNPAAAHGSCASRPGGG
jgi:hypothetical protein